MLRRSLAIAPLLVGCASQEPVAREHAALLHGAPTTSDPAVVALVPRPLHCGARLPAYCTGVLVAPRAILTAAHCLEGRRAVDVRAFFGPVATGAGRSIDVVAATIHPGYDAASGANDLAVLTLATASDAAPIATDATTVAIDASLVGATVRLVGYGVDDTGATGTARAGGATVTSVDAALVRYAPGPAMTCGGDSGGPVFHDAGAGAHLIAITRSGDAACASFGTATRLDAAQGFLADAIAATTAAPSPSIYGEAVDACASHCATDAECPLAMQCLNERTAGLRCGMPAGLGSGRFGAACAADGDCGAGACLAMGDDACRCFTPCDAPSAAVPSGSSGGCAVAPRPWRGGLAGLVVLALAAGARRDRRRRR